MTESGRDPFEAPEGIRLQKVLAAAGIASRRASEILISAGRVSVNGKMVRELGTRVRPDEDIIRVDGQRVSTAPGQVHLVLNKPRGVVTTMHDEHGRRCVGDLVAGQGTGLFHVGRLDQDTDGLLVVTNDGELAHRLSHPSWGVSKTYLAEVEGRVAPAELARLRGGVELDGRPVATERVKVQGRTDAGTLLEIVIHEGRNHVIRRMCEEVGHPVRRLARTAFGNIRLGSLASGQVRALNREELSGLYRLVEL
jgi:23S rRNA pseudouridine2605 synthase